MLVLDLRTDCHCSSHNDVSDQPKLERILAEQSSALTPEAGLRLCRGTSSVVKCSMTMRTDPGIRACMLNLIRDVVATVTTRRGTSEHLDWFGALAAVCAAYCN